MKTRTFITRTLSDIFPGQKEFDDGVMSKLSFKLSDEEKQYLFTLIFSRYADSHSRYTNEVLFAMNLIKEINCYYPMTLAIIRDQKQLRDTDNAKFARGSKSVENLGAGNTANISTDTIEGIKQLDSQRIVNTERAEFDILRQRLAEYQAGEEDKFLNRFVRFFVQIIYPQHDLLYITPPGESEEEGEF